MRRSILQKFIIVVFLALVLSGTICYLVTTEVISAETRRDMAYALQLVDYNMNYKENLEEQIGLLKNAVSADETRLTIMDLKGRVLADSAIDALAEMESHLNRPEVQEAIKIGQGYSRRYSKTLGTTMLYMAKTSDYGDYIVRLALPSSGETGYLKSLLPAIFLSLLLTLSVTFFLAIRFSNTITRPLKEISEEMYKLQHRNPEFHFGKYKYEELNTIAETTTKMSETINNTMEKLEQEKIIRQQFFSNVSHELKTPITSIQGYAELLENNIVTSEEMKTDFLRRIKKETMNMADLINDILMISKLETKQVEVVKTEIRMKSLLEEVLDSLAPLAAKYTIAMNTECEPVSIMANPKYIHQLLTNLIVNAITYNNPGGMVEVRISEDKNNLLLIVKDNGVGIPPESVSRVFERFYRVDKGRSRKMGGTGLGLAIVKHIVQYYQGSIDLKSELEVGTVISIWLPVLK